MLCRACSRRDDHTAGGASWPQGFVRHEETGHVKGTVSQVKWQNPHVLIFIDVPDATGKVVTWGFENSNVHTLATQGYNRNTLKFGQPITAATGWIEASHAKDDAIGDGGGRGRDGGSAAAQTQFDPRDLSGIWTISGHRSISANVAPMTSILGSSGPSACRRRPHRRRVGGEHAGHEHRRSR